MFRTFAILSLLVACGGAAEKTPPADGIPPLPDGTSDYAIDSGAAISPPLGRYGLTTNGDGDWILAWTSDIGSKHFTGDVYCPVGCDLNAVFQNALPGDSINTLANNHVGFDAVADASVPQQLNIATNGLTQNPLTLDLYIDGVPAAG